MTGGFYYSAASALLPLSARHPISLLVLLTSAPSGQRESPGQQHAAAQTAEREFALGAVKIQQPAGLALLLEPGPRSGTPCLSANSAPSPEIDLPILLTAQCIESQTISQALT